MDSTDSTEWALAEKIRLLELYMDKDILWDKRAEVLQDEFAKRRSTNFFTVKNIKSELHQIFSKPNPQHHIDDMPKHPRGKEAAELWLKHFRKELAEYRERQKQMFIVAMRHQLDLIRRFQQGKVLPAEIEAIITAARERDAHRPDREIYEAKLKEMMEKIRPDDLKNIRTFSDYYRYIRGERVPTPPPEPKLKVEESPPPVQQREKTPTYASPSRYVTPGLPEPVLKAISPTRTTTTYDSIAATIGIVSSSATTNVSAAAKITNPEKRRVISPKNVTGITPFVSPPVVATPTAEAGGEIRKQQQTRRKPAQKVAGRQITETKERQQEHEEVESEKQESKPSQRVLRHTATAMVSPIGSFSKGTDVQLLAPPPTTMRMSSSNATATTQSSSNTSALPMTRKRKRGELDLLISGEPLAAVNASESEEPPAKNLRRTSSASQQPSPAASISGISTPLSTAPILPQQPVKIEQQKGIKQEKQPSTPVETGLLIPTLTQPLKAVVSKQLKDSEMGKASLLLQSSPIATPPIISEIAAATKLRSSIRRAAIASSTPSPAVSSVSENGLYLRPTSHKSTEILSKNILQTLWKDIRSHRYSYVFDQPVSEAEVPGYHSAIKKPMDLKTLKSRIESGEVKTFGEFQRDIALMFANAVLYNSTGHYVNIYAKELFAFALKCIQLNQYPSGQWTTSAPSTMATSTSSNSSIGTH